MAQLQAFRENRELQQFVLTNVTPTGKKLGTGSFGSVEEVRNDILLNHVHTDCCSYDYR